MFMNMNIELLCKSTDVDIDGCTLSQEVIFFLINVNIHIYQKLSYKKQELLTILHDALPIFRILSEYDSLPDTIVCGLELERQRSL
jgi:hypothetical protein